MQYSECQETPCPQMVPRSSPVPNLKVEPLVPEVKESTGSVLFPKRTSSLTCRLASVISRDNSSSVKKGSYIGKSSRAALQSKASPSFNEPSVFNNIGSSPDPLLPVTMFGKKKPVSQEQVRWHARDSVYVGDVHDYCQ